MLTARGWWLLITLLALLVLGLGLGTAPLFLLATTALAWILGTWLSFVIRVQLLRERWVVERELHGERGPVRQLFSGQNVEVRVRLVVESSGHLHSLLALPYVSIGDRVPALGRLIDGEQRAAGPLSAQQSLEVRYRIECVAVGKLLFQGLQVQVADLQGFFQYSLFVQVVESYPVYPVLAERRGNLPTAKRHNILPILGTHRHRRPGSGSELLDLRDYLPGDPPKMIAWKASARRDRLMSKELESEVPIRCTLFVDVSMAVRVGTVGRNVLSRFVDIAGAVLQSSARVKDLVGLCLFDDNGVRTMIRPKRGPRHGIEMTAALARAADLPLLSDHVALDALLPLAFGLAQEVYPEWLDQAVNRFPTWLAWWSPQPAYARPLPPRRGRGLWSLLHSEWKRTLHHRATWLVGRLSPARRRQYRWRKQLAAILSVRHDLGLDGLAQLLEDDDLCSRHVQRFLAEHQVAFPVPLYTAQGRYLFASPRKVDVLARAVLSSVARGRDNELFVVLVDLLEVDHLLEPLLRAFQVARARHHRVLVVCTWPRGVPLPGEDENPGRLEQTTTSLQQLYFLASRVRLQQAGTRVKRALARLGVPMLFSPEERAVPLILEEMQRLRLQERGGP